MAQILKIIKFLFKIFFFYKQKTKLTVFNNIHKNKIDFEN